MNKDKDAKQNTGSRRMPRWVMVLFGLVLVWLVLNTRVNLNSPLELLADPYVDIEAAIAKKEKGDYAAILPVLILGIGKNDPFAHYVLADYYANGVSPFHVDPCSAFDHYLFAAKLGYPEAQLSVGQMLVKEYGNKDRKDSYLTVKWHLYSRKMWYGQAYITIYNDFANMSKADRAALVERSAPDLFPTNVPDGTTSSSSRMPVIPIFWRLMRYVMPMRACQDPTVLDHLRGVLG